MNLGSGGEPSVPTPFPILALGPPEPFLPPSVACATVARMSQDEATEFLYDILKGFDPAYNDHDAVALSLEALKGHTTGELVMMFYSLVGMFVGLARTAFGDEKYGEFVRELEERDREGQ